MGKVKEFFTQKLIDPVHAQLKQGANPQGLALTGAMGVSLALFPILGSTTALCLLVGIALKLNQPVLQAVNYLLYPVQIALIPFFLVTGEKWFSNEKISFQPAVMKDEFMADPTLFMSKYGMAGVHGILVWLILAPILSWIVYQICVRVFSKWRTAT